MIPIGATPGKVASWSPTHVPAVTTSIKYFQRAPMPLFNKCRSAQQVTFGALVLVVVLASAAKAAHRLPW